MSCTKCEKGKKCKKSYVGKLCKKANNKNNTRKFRVLTAKTAKIGKLIRSDNRSMQTARWTHGPSGCGRTVVMGAYVNGNTGGSSVRGIFNTTPSEEGITNFTLGPGEWSIMFNARVQVRDFDTGTGTAIPAGSEFFVGYNDRVPPSTGIILNAPAPGLLGSEEGILDVSGMSFGHDDLKKLIVYNSTADIKRLYVDLVGMFKEIVTETTTITPVLVWPINRFVGSSNDTFIHVCHMDWRVERIR